jgi:hypothetical protein
VGLNSSEGRRFNGQPGTVISKDPNIPGRYIVEFGSQKSFTIRKSVRLSKLVARVPVNRCDSGDSTKPVTDDRPKWLQASTFQKVLNAAHAPSVTLRDARLQNITIDELQAAVDSPQVRSKAALIDAVLRLAVSDLSSKNMRSRVEILEARPGTSQTQRTGWEKSQYCKRLVDLYTKALGVSSGAATASGNNGPTRGVPISDTAPTPLLAARIVDTYKVDGWSSSDGALYTTSRPAQTPHTAGYSWTHKAPSDDDHSSVSRASPPVYVFKAGSGPPGMNSDDDSAVPMDID